MVVSYIAKNKYSCFLLIMLLLLTLVAICANYIAPYDPVQTELSNKLAPPGNGHILGTDHLGRDMFSRLMYGMRVSLLSVLIITAFVMLFSIVVGCIAGYRGGIFDSVLMRICDVFLTFPMFILALFFIGIFDVGLINVIVAMIITHWAWYARLIRGLVLEYKSKQHVLAARSKGSSSIQIIRRHILPSVLVQMLILATMDLGHMMLDLAALSFLGLSVQAPGAEWGVMIKDASPYIMENPELILYPGLCIFLIVALFNGLGETLRDKLDPSLGDVL